MALSPVHLMCSPFQNIAFCISMPRAPGAALMHLDTGHHADATDVSNHRMILEAPDGIKEIGFHAGRLFEQTLF